MTDDIVRTTYITKEDVEVEVKFLNDNKLHRTWSFNEVSARYSELPTEFWEPEIWRQQSKSNKQCSEGEVLNEEVPIEYEGGLNQTKFAYNILLQANTAREQARAVLPVATYTKFIAKVDLHNLLHFLKLRLHPHAQKEIRDYAEIISEWVKVKLPNVWKAFNDYELNSVTLTAVDLEYISLGELGRMNFEWPTKREKTEFEEKWKKLKWLK